MTKFHKFDNGDFELGKGDITKMSLIFIGASPYKRYALNRESRVTSCLILGKNCG